MGTLLVVITLNKQGSDNLRFWLRPIIMFQMFYYSVLFVFSNNVIPHRRGSLNHIRDLVSGWTEESKLFFFHVCERIAFNGPRELAVIWFDTSIMSYVGGGIKLLDPDRLLSVFANGSIMFPVTTVNYSDNDRCRTCWPNFLLNSAVNPSQFSGTDFP